MIQFVLDILINQLSDYIRASGNNIEEPPVVLGNIGLSTALGGTESYMQDKVVLSLVNSMEEPTMKNKTPYRRGNSHSEMLNPPAYLNLYLLFTANYTNVQGGGASNDTPYINGITRLSQVIEFFQSQNTFSIRNAPSANNISNPRLKDIKVVLELYSLTFEQVNHLWGSLGGKQMPFALYKTRIIPIKRDKVTGRGGLITDIHNNAVQIQ